MRVCFWATTFQADNQAMACYLAEQPGLEVVVALDAPDSYASEPGATLLPFRGTMVDRRAWSTSLRLRAGGFDVLVVDNHLPRLRLAPRVFVLWHGFGWRIDDISAMRRQLQGLVGDVSRPCPRFIWQAFGEWDRRYRIESSGISAENVQALGSAYSDLLLPESSPFRDFDPASVRSAYRIDVGRRKTILVGLTWHHDGAFGHWGDERDLLRRFFEHAERRDAFVLMRMHDRFRYPPRYAAAVEELAGRHENVQLKWKDTSPDSLVDLLIADVTVSNYSSLLNAVYYTRKPTVHIDSVGQAASGSVYRRIRGRDVVEVPIADPRSLWKLDPAEIGGLRARSFDELLAAVDRSLADPTCCVDAARAFVDRYVTGADGTTRRRIADVLTRWVTTA